MGDSSDRTFIAAEDPEERRPLTGEVIRDVWTRTYNVDGKPDWGNIYPYCHEDIIFSDPIQRHEGLAVGPFGV